MKSKITQLVLCSAFAALAWCAAAFADDPSHDAFTYQGQLQQNGEPATGPLDLKFRLFNALNLGSQEGLELAMDGFADFDEQGRFSIDLAFGKEIFDGTPLWLEIQVGASVLSPRQPIMPTPYAVRALNVATVADNALIGTYTNPLALNNGSNTFAGNGSGLTGLNASSIASGTLGSARLSGTYSNALTLNSASNSFTGNGAGLTSLNASNITSGTLPSARLNGTYSSALNLSNGSNSYAGNGSGLFDLNASNIDTGTLPGGRLSGTYSNALTLSSASNSFTGNGAGLNGLNASNISTGTLAMARLATGGTWQLSSSLSIDNTLFVHAVDSRVGIGTSGPIDKLHVQGGGVYVSGGNVSVEFGGHIRAPNGTSTNPSYRFSNGTDLTGFSSPADDTVAIIANGLERVRVTSTGLVGIGTESPTQLLSVNGTAGKVGGGSWSVFSDVRLKKNVQPLHNSLDQLLALRGVTYEYIDPAAINERSGMCIGMIAQEVEQVFPEWVSDTPRGYKSLAFSGFEALTVEALRDLRTEKDAQLAHRDAEIESLRNENAELTARLEALEQAVMQMMIANTGGSR